jgi:CRISPR-associated endonuclease/helicase Cas3
MREPKCETPRIGVIPFESCVAKTISNSGTTVPGSTVVEHCSMVGLVARELLSRMPALLRLRLFPEGSELIAAYHDIGKVSPGFEAKIFAACGQDRGIGVPPSYDELAGYHAAVGAAALSSEGAYVADIVGRHHGTSAALLAPPDAEIYGGAEWQAERLKLKRFLEARFGGKAPAIANDAMADAISGLVCVSDWIGSGDTLSHGATPDREKVAQALDDAGFVPFKIRRGLGFKDVFSFEPNGMQEAACDLVRPGGVIVVEAPMGIGKTEAGLYVAYRLLEKGQANGVYFALPTRATSDRIHERFGHFLDAILEPGSPHREAQLLHGTAWLRKTVMGEEAAPGGSWFDSPKRGILAPFAVGTIDQALLAVMNVRFGFVRSFGLAGKVVILDEVHSYDCYTGTLLDALVKALGALGCTTIILSATLTRKRRSELIDASVPVDDGSPCEAYPLLTSRDDRGELTAHAVPAGETATVNIAMKDDSEAAIEEAVHRACGGQQVLWIENTVDEAQDAFGLLSARAAACGLPSGLLHSRFTACDRERKEAEWVSLYGKEGSANRGESGRILVGTQVLEQSLDIDADFLISRLAPMDMILQRIGRLWRHRSNDGLRDRIGARRDAWILTPSLERLSALPESIGKSAYVYAPYVLLRTRETLNGLRSIGLPGDIRSLIEETYRERSESAEFERYRLALEKEREKLRRLARGCVGSGGKTISDCVAATRYADTETRDVILLRNFRPRGDGLVLEMLEGERIEIARQTPASGVRREIAARLLAGSLAVPARQAPSTPRASIRGLAPYLYLGDGDESAVAVGLVGEDGYIRGVSGTSQAAALRITYTDRFGFKAE